LALDGATLARLSTFGETASMKKLLIVALIFPTLAASPPVAPMTPDQKERINCVAAMAVAAHDQQRGAPGWEGIPWLKDRGARFAGLTGEAIMKETGRTQGEVRDEILKAVAEFQKANPEKANLQAIAREKVQECITLMDKLDPPPPLPGMTRCAAIATLAYEDERARSGNSSAAKQLGLIAAALSSYAHDDLRSQGKTQAEGDIAIGLEKEKITKAALARQTKGEDSDSDTRDFEYCASLAVPKEK
jgi:hypothetical protein